MCLTNVSRLKASNSETKIAVQLCEIIQQLFNSRLNVDMLLNELLNLFEYHPRKTIFMRYQKRSRNHNTHKHLIF